MKSTGIVRKIDKLGRIVLPAELRKTMNIEERDPLEIFVDGQYIMLTKHEPSCLFCGAHEDVDVYKDKTYARLVCGISLSRQPRREVMRI